MVLSPQELLPSHGLEALAQSGGQFLSLFEHGSLIIEIYKPEKVDLQNPHTRDEVYIIVSGTGWFVNGEARHRFEPGQLLFVPAGVEHRFEDFTEDFSTWVIFYGPEGGEARLLDNGKC
jgi:mannose-6-phosphate isomerase-like protein (cupin superfamily)